MTYFFLFAIIFWIRWMIKSYEKKSEGTYTMSRYIPLSKYAKTIYIIWNGWSIPVKKKYTLLSVWINKSNCITLFHIFFKQKIWKISLFFLKGNVKPHMVFAFVYVLTPKSLVSNRLSAPGLQLALNYYLLCSKFIQQSTWYQISTISLFTKYTFIVYLSNVINLCDPSMILVVKHKMVWFLKRLEWIHVIWNRGCVLVGLLLLAYI